MVQPPDLPSRDSSAPEDLGQALRRASDGDEAAWRAIVTHFAPRVHGLLRAQCGDAELSEEIAQSTFCTIAAKIDSYVEAGKFEAWLFRIAMNRLRDELRRRSRHAVPTEESVLSGLAGDRASAGPSSAGADERQALRDAIAGLPPADQRVIHLRHQADLSFKQIAEVLGEPLGTVLARHHRALRKLREHLLASGIDPGGSGS